MNYPTQTHHYQENNQQFYQFYDIFSFTVDSDSDSNSQQASKMELEESLEIPTQNPDSKFSFQNSQQKRSISSNPQTFNPIFANTNKYQKNLTLPTIEEQLDSQSIFDDQPQQKQYQKHQYIQNNHQQQTIQTNSENPSNSSQTQNKYQKYGPNSHEFQEFLDSLQEWNIFFEPYQKDLYKIFTQLFDMNENEKKRPKIKISDIFYPFRKVSPQNLKVIFTEYEKCTCPCFEQNSLQAFEINTTYKNIYSDKSCQYNGSYHKKTIKRAEKLTGKENCELYDFENWNRQGVMMLRLFPFKYTNVFTNEKRNKIQEAWENVFKIFLRILNEQFQHIVIISTHEKISELCYEILDQNAHFLLNSSMSFKSVQQSTFLAEKNILPSINSILNCVGKQQIDWQI